jgi:gas vesicle protein
MNLDDHAFHQLHVAAERELGVDQANTLMTVLPREPAGELVTKSFFRSELDQRFALTEANLRLEMAELRSELKGEMAELRSELKAEIAELRSELKAEITELRSELKAEITDVRNESRIGLAEVRAEMHRLAYRQNVQMWTAMFLVQGLFFTAGQLLS